MGNAPKKPECPRCGLLNGHRYPCTANDHDDDMFDGDEPEREPIDHQAQRWDHQRDLRKHGDT